MAGPVLSVAVQADTSDMITKLAAMRAAFNSAMVEVNKGAREAAKAGQDFNSTFSPAVATAAAAAARAKAEMNSLGAALREKLKPAVDDAKNAHSGLLGVLNANKSAFSELEHVARSTIDGLASGADPMRIFAQEFSRVAQAMTQFNGISFATVARFAAIGSAAVAAATLVGTFYTRMAQMRDSNDLSASFSARNLEIPGSVIQSYRRYLVEAGQSVEAVSKLNDEQIDHIIASFAKIPKLGPGITGGLVHLLPDYAAMTHASQDVEHVTDELSSAFTNLDTKGRELARSLDLTGGVLKQFNALDNDPMKQAAFLMKALSDATTKYGQDKRSAAANNIALPTSVGGVGEAGAIADMEQAQRLQEAAERSKKAWDDFQTSIATMPKLAPSLTAVGDELEKINQKAEANKQTADQALAAQVTYLKGLKDISDDPALTRLYDAKVYEQQKAASAQALTDIRLQAKQAADAAAADRKDEAAAALAVMRQGLNDARLDGEARKALAEEIAGTDMRFKRAEATEAKKTNQEIWEDYKANSQKQIDEAKNNYTQKIALLKAEQTEALKIFGNTAQGRLEADKVGAEIAQAQYAQMEQQLNATKTQLSTMANMAAAAGNLESIGAKNKPGEFKPSIGLVFDSSSLDSEVNAQIAKLKAKLTTELAALSQEIKGTLDLADSVKVSNPQQYAQLVEQASAAYAKMAELTKQFADQSTELNQRAAQAVQQSWEKIVGPIGNAFDTLVSDALSGHQRISVAAEKAAASVLESWLKSIAKQVSAWVAGEAMKLFSSRATDTAVAATDQQGINQEIANIAKSLEHYIAAEQAKTGAAVAGGAAQATAQTAAATTGRAAQAEASGKSIMGDAAKAFSGTYASVSEIPVVGWLLAPILASAAFAAVAGYETMASAEGGWDRVPYDGAPAILHKNEMVLPANIAEGVRQMTGGGMNNPAAARASLSGSSSVVNRSGDIAHSLTLNHSPTINIQGTGNGTADYARAARSEGDRMYSRMQSWYGNNQVSLPGRKPWR